MRRAALPTDRGAAFPQDAPPRPLAPRRACAGAVAAGYAEVTGREDAAMDVMAPHAPLMLAVVALAAPALALLARCAADGDRAALLARLERRIIEIEWRIATLEGRPPA
jgi:hypothetical protein